MRSSLLRTVGSSLFLLTCWVGLAAAESPIGPFQDHKDIGNPIPAGEASYFENDEWTYQVKAGGADATMPLPTGYAIDGHAIQSRISGDFTFRATVYTENQDKLMHNRNSGAGILMADTDNLGTMKNFFGLWMNSDNQGAQVQVMIGQAANIPALIEKSQQDGRFEINRKGDVFEAYYVDKTDNIKKKAFSAEIPIKEPLYVCLYTTSELPGKYTIGYFKDVELIINASVNNWDLHD